MSPTGIFGTFSREKILRTRLNRAGLQVGRILLARTSRLARGLTVGCPPEFQGNLAELRREGVTRVEAFLAPGVFEEVRRECLALLDSDCPRNIHRHGSTTVEHIQLRTAPGISETRRWWVENAALRGFCSAAERRQLLPSLGSLVLERVTFSAEAEPDREAELHADTFFDSHKGWLYLDDVESEDGPLVTVPGSAAIDPIRLVGEYRHSLDPQHRSRRVPPHEYLNRGLHEVHATGKANTLVVANTFGYHRRSRGQPNRQRVALQFSYRLNPFVPGFLGNWAQRLRFWLKDLR